ncbi:MAG: condensation domain-containing protein, partial [Planctomycetota bacterium]
IYFVDQIPKSLTGKVRRHELAKPLELQFKTQSVDSGKQHSAVSMSPLERCIAETWAGVLRIDLPGTHDNFFQLGGESLLRQSLPSDDFSSGLESGYVEPRNPIEQRLASIWSELLGIKQVGIQDNFFALGGHSLLAARLTSRVSDVFGFRMSVRQLFEHPSIAGQALLIEATHLLDNNGPSIRLVHRPHEVGKAAPLSHAQQRLWFLEQLEGTLTAYNIPRAWRIRGSLDIESLRKALEAIVLRHEPLRTIFKHDGTIPVQIVKQIGRFDLPVLDLLNFDPRVKETQLEQSILSEISRAFDLTCDVMLRAKLLKLGDNEHELLLTMHHIASDGWSIAVLSRELSVLYHHFLETPDGPTDDVTGLLDPLPVNYIDYTLWQRENLSERRIEGLLEYWREELQGLPALELPTDRPRPSTTSYQGSSIEVKLPEGLISKLESLCSSEQVTLQMLLLAAFESLLYRYSHQEDFAIGIPFAGREDSQLEDLIGFFVSTLVIRADLSGEPTFQELLSRVRQKSLAAYDHQALPLQVLLAELQPERHLSRPPLFQVMFQLLSRNEAGLTLQGLEVTDEDHGSNRVKFDLELHLSRHTGDISGAFYYSTDLFDSETIQRMALHYLRLLESIAANPNLKVSQLEILTEQERSELLFGFNNTAKDYPRDLCVHELFEQQVERTPDAVALVFEDQQLTYAELNARANRLARYLRSKGVGTQTSVGLCLERSLDLVVSILGILKAGATYVPLDAEYPTKRLEHMLKNARIEHLVTQSELLEKLPKTDRIDICTDTDANQISSEDTKDLSIELDSKNLAYVIFTSGSTGEPKGVAVPHSCLVNLLYDMKSRLGFSKGDSLLSVT